ncbi:hypothetical protein DER44DRAFT_816409 [Fusarium oxysporum]|nr:hypothetical protein DER44DRAFT_816409 [Fusarium oxysporum]
MGRRAVTNPNKIESERERARNRRFLKRQMQQTLVREECSGHRGVRMVDPTRNLVSLEDASRHNARPVSNIAGPSIYQVRVPISVSVSTAHGSAVSAPGLDNRVSSNLTFCDATDPRVIPSFTNQPIHLQYGSSELTNRRHRATTGAFGSLASVQRPFVNRQADVEDSSVEPQDSPSDDTTLPAAQPRNETLQNFIDAIRQGNAGLNPEFLDPYKDAYDQIFRVFYSSKCNCTQRVEGNEAEPTHSLRERVEQLQQCLPPLSTVFGETGSYDPSSSFQQWKGFLADQPIQPLSFNKSSEALAHPDQPALSLSRQWDIDSIWFGAKGLQAIRSPNDFRFARFSAFLFFPNAAKDMTSSTRNALSLERQKDLYDHVIIPAAFEAVSDPCRQELPRTYEIAYAKSRSFQERSGNNRWKPEDVSRAVHLQYTIPAENLSQFWNLIAEKANSFRLATKSGELVSYFKDLKLLFQSHDLKNTFGRATLSESLHYFQASVLQAFDPAHLEIRSCWIDIGTRDYVVSPPSSSQPVREPCTVFWKSQCHPHLHEQLSRCAPTSPMNAQNFQRFLLRDLGDYQVKAKHTRASNPGHPDEHKPGIIRAKAYSCHKELFSVMFSGYELFGSGHLPLLALNQSMISDLSSANQGRHQAPTFHVQRDALSKAWDANKRHLRAAMDTRNSTNYAIRKEMTFRLDTILTMWHDGYFEPSQNPHMAPKSLEVSAASARTDHEPFWVVPTKDINDFVFTQAARFIVPLDHLFREAAISTTISPPSLILAFYTAQLFCRLLTYALTSKEQFSYDNWIWLSRWTARSRTHHTRELRERQGLGLSVIIQDSGMLWIPYSCIDWYDGHIALETLIQLYIPRNPFQRGLLSQMNVQRLAASAITKTDFDRGCQRSGDEVVEKAIRLMTEEIARAYHQHMIAKLQLYWERLRTQVGRHVLPCLQRLEQAKQESAAQIYDEAWGAYIRIHPISTSEDLPPNVPCWMATRKYIPPNDSWSESVFRRLFDCENVASWTGLWGVVEGYTNPYILVTFNSDLSKDLTTDRRLGTWYQQAAFFRIQYWAPYFSPPDCVDFSSWVSVANHQIQNPYTPSPEICSALNAIEYQDRSNMFTQLWAQTRAKEKNRICEQAMDCLIDLIALVLPWRFSDSIIGAERHQDYLRLPILTTSSRQPSIPSRPTIILPSRHNVMALIEAIESFPRINQEILRRAKWIREMLHNEGKQYAMCSHLEAKQKEMDAVSRPHSLLRKFLAQTTPPQSITQNFGTITEAS